MTDLEEIVVLYVYITILKKSRAQIHQLLQRRVSVCIHGAQRTTSVQDHGTDVCRARKSCPVQRCVLLHITELWIASSVQQKPEINMLECTPIHTHVLTGYISIWN